jgi:hypothetical protein
MKPSVIISLIGILSCGVSLADIPKKKSLQQYSGLWTNSPFTTKPVVTGGAPQANIFDDYHLTGIAPVKDGYRITVTHKKTKEKVVIEPGVESKFKVLAVERNPDIHLGTVVSLTNGSTNGTVKFEPKLVTLNTPTGQQQVNPQQDQLPPGFNPNAPNNQTATPGANVRPRIVTPGNPGGNGGQQQITSPPQPGNPSSHQQRFRR